MVVVVVAAALQRCVSSGWLVGWLGGLWTATPLLVYLPPCLSPFSLGFAKIGFSRDRLAVVVARRPIIHLLTQPAQSSPVQHSPARHLDCELHRWKQFGYISYRYR